MMKLSTIASVLLALGLLGAGSTSGQDGREECLKQVAELFVSRSVPEDVAGLVEAIRKAKPDFINHDFDEDLERFDDVDYEPIDSTGCPSLLNNITGDERFRCLQGLEPQGQLFLDLVATDKGSQPIAEALAACWINEELLSLQDEDGWRGSTSGQENREECLKEVGKLFASRSVPDDVVGLVKALREANPNFIRSDLDESLRRSDYVDYKPINSTGCTDLFEFEANEGPECLEGLDPQGQLFFDLVEANPGSEPAIEALAACSINQQLMTIQDAEEADRTCSAEVSQFVLAQATQDLVSADVVELMERLRKDTPDIMSLPDDETQTAQDFKIFTPVDPTPAGCDKLFKIFDEVNDKFECFKGIEHPLRMLVATNPDIKTVAEALMACGTNSDLLNPIQYVKTIHIPIE